MKRFSIGSVIAVAGVGLALVAVAFQPSFAQQTPDTSAAPSLLAFVGGRVIDGTGRPAIENGTVVINRGRVEAVGPAATTRVPAGAVRVDVTGKTLMPGIISAHTHVALQKRADEPEAYRNRWFDSGAALSDREQFLAELRVYADYGITTIYTLGEDLNRGFSTDAEIMEVVQLRDEQEYSQEHGMLTRARVYLSGANAASNKAGPFGVKTAEEGRANVDRNAAMRVNFIKINVNETTTPELISAIIDESHQHGLMTLSHIAAYNEAKLAMDWGINALAHSVRDRDVDQAFIDQMKSRSVGQIATLSQEQSNFRYDSTPAFFADPWFLRHGDYFRKQVDALKEPASQQALKESKTAQASRPRVQQAMRNLKRMSDAGVLIAMGTDSGGRREAGRFPGYDEYIELGLMAEAGMTPMQIITAATSGSARIMRFDENLGTLQPGKWADVLVLNANPLTDIKNVRQIDSVWIAGRKMSRPPQPKMP